MTACLMVALMVGGSSAPVKVSCAPVGEVLGAAITMDAKAAQQQATALLEAKNLPAAAHVLEHCIRLDARDAQCHGLLGLVLARLGQPERAEACFGEHFRMTLNLNPGIRYDGCHLPVWHQQMFGWQSGCGTRAYRGRLGDKAPH